MTFFGALLAIVLGFTQQTGQSSEQSVMTFKTAPPAGKVNTLARIGNSASQPLSAQSVEIIQAGLHDTDATVKQRALDALTMLAFVGRVRKAREAPEQWATELETLKPLAKRAEQLLDDPDSKVRLSAVLAFGNLDATPGKNQLSVGSMRRLAQMSKDEPSGKVRAEILKVFALAADMRPSVPTEEMITAGLGDTESEVLQYAAMGVGKAKLGLLLPRLIPLLSHNDKSVRLAAAVSFGLLPSESRAFVKDLERAAADEVDEPIRRTLRAAIQNAQKPR